MYHIHFHSDGNIIKVNFILVKKMLFISQMIVYFFNCFMFLQVYHRLEDQVTSLYKSSNSLKKWLTIWAQ